MTDPSAPNALPPEHDPSTTPSTAPAGSVDVFETPLPESFDPALNVNAGPYGDPDITAAVDTPAPVIPPNFDPGTPDYITQAGSETGMAVTTSQPTQVAHPGKATVRTVVAYVAAVLLAGTVALPIIADYFDAYLPPKVKSVILATAGFCGVVIACATRLMAVPAVNQLLTRIGLGASK